MSRAYVIWFQSSTQSHIQWLYNHHHCMRRTWQGCTWLSCLGMKSEQQGLESQRIEWDDCLMQGGDGRISLNVFHTSEPYSRRSQHGKFQRKNSRLNGAQWLESLSQEPRTPSRTLSVWQEHSPGANRVGVSRKRQLGAEQHIQPWHSAASCGRGTRLSAHCLHCTVPHKKHCLFQEKGIWGAFRGSEEPWRWRAPLFLFSYITCRWSAVLSLALPSWESHCLEHTHSPHPPLPTTHSLLGDLVVFTVHAVGGECFDLKVHPAALWGTRTDRHPSVPPLLGGP